VLTAREVRGGIIAAGQGSRLAADGFRAPKPLVEVAGVPLIATVLRNFQAAGIGRVTIILNADEVQCVEWIRAHFSGLDLEFIVKTTASSLESFREVTAGAPPGPMLVSTVDAWCAAADFARFAARAAARPSESTVLGVTPFVSDEKPLWVTLGPEGRVTALSEPGALVTAGVYRVSDRARRLAGATGPTRLREYLAWLLAHDEPMYGEVIETVVDVDRGVDVASAEALADPRTRRT